jgi:alcohol dehydrogenase class IV
LTTQELRQYFAPTRLVHGAGTLARVGPEAKALGAGSALVVTDQGLVRAGLLDGVVQALQAEGIPAEVYADVPVDPGTECVRIGVELVHALQADIIVGVGGGSPMCAAKAIAIVAANGGTIRDYAGFGKVVQRPLPTICIPTTAGSGTEVSAVTIITDEERHIKMAVGSPLVYPPLAILDPELLISLPFRQAAESGIDALSHAIEACLTTQATPLTNALALGAVRLFAENLAVAARTRDVEAKGACLLGSSMANMACGNARLALNHALTWPISCLFNVPHGLANGIMLPYTLEFVLANADPGAATEAMARVAAALGESPEAPVEQVARQGITRVKALLEDLDFPTHFSPEQLDPAKIPEMVDMLLEQGIYSLFRQVTLRVAGGEDLAELYERATLGWMLEA